MRGIYLYKKGINDKSTMTPDEYLTFILIIGSFVAMANYLFNILLIGCTSSRQDTWIAIAASTVVAIITYYCTRRDRRTGFQGLIAIVTGAGLYTLYIYWKIMPMMCRIISLVALSAIPISIIIYISVGKRGRRSVLRYIYKRVTKSKDLSRILIGVVALVACLIIPITYRIHPEGVYRVGSAAELKENDKSAGNIKYQQEEYRVAEVYGDEYRLSENVDRMRILISEEEWDKASIEEKQDSLIAVVECQARYWGFPYKLNIVFSGDLPYTTKGFYSHSEHLICINNNAVLRDSASDNLVATLHELRHCYQHAMCDAYVKLSPEERNLYAFYGIDKWCENINNYKSGEDSYYEYCSQILEKDARSSSESEAGQYLVQIYQTLKEANNQTEADSKDNTDS